MKRNLSLSLESRIYEEVKHFVPHGQISLLVNDLLKDYLKEKKQLALKASYEEFRQNQNLKTELAIWDEAVGDGVQ